jgi:hypothetical protein
MKAQRKLGSPKLGTTEETKWFIEKRKRFHGANLSSEEKMFGNCQATRGIRMSVNL